MELTGMQEHFVIEYIKCRNATEAARRAGYAHPNKQGPRLLVNVGISDEIARLTKENAMEADEVLSRLADMARGSIEDFVSFAYGPYPVFTLDLDKARRRNKLHLIKKLKYDKDGNPEIELHDAQSALAHLGKYLGLFKDSIEIENKWMQEIAELLKEGRVTREEVEQELGTDLASRLFESVGITASTSRET